MNRELTDYCHYDFADDVYLITLVRKLTRQEQLSKRARKKRPAPHDKG